MLVLAILQVIFFMWFLIFQVVKRNFIALQYIMLADIEILTTISLPFSNCR